MPLRRLDERRALLAGDYSIEGYEDSVAVEQKTSIRLKMA